MRRFMPALAILGALAAQPVLAGQQCASPADQETFEVQALRSRLVVLGSTNGCPDEALYQAFIEKFRPTLQANAQALSAWFKKRYGARGQFEHDKFVTELTQAVGSAGSMQGTDFCAHDSKIFNEVLALRSGADLAAYAAAKDLIPASIDACPGQVAAKPAPRPAVKR
jgi:hypothetical protein